MAQNGTAELDGEIYGKPGQLGKDASVYGKGQVLEEMDIEDRDVYGRAETESDVYAYGAVYGNTSRPELNLRSTEDCLNEDDEENEHCREAKPRTEFESPERDPSGASENSTTARLVTNSNEYIQDMRSNSRHSQIEIKKSLPDAFYQPSSSSQVQFRYPFDRKPNLPVAATCPPSSVPRGLRTFSVSEGSQGAANVFKSLPNGYFPLGDLVGKPYFNMKFDLQEASKNFTRISSR